MSSGTSDVVDLDAICARPSLTPAGDLRPPDLLSIAPPMESGVGEDTRGHRVIAFVAKTTRQQRLLAGAAGAMFLVGLVVAFATSGSAQATQVARAARSSQASLSATSKAGAGLSGVVAGVGSDEPIVAPASTVGLPPPPTTGAPAAKGPPARSYAVSAAAAAAKARVAPASPGPKMTKISSTGVEQR